MVRLAPVQRAQSEASTAATRLHRRLGTTFDGPVDVLAIARELGIVLMMQPLDALLGFYVRGEERAGVVINSQLPESLQRFTLAHEIGHHVLGHEGSIDDQHALDRFDSASITEAAAQAFASSLVMPIPLVARALRDLPAIKGGRRLSPSDAYLFSRQLGVSFSAGVWALHRQNQLDLATARAYIRAGSLSAKDAIRGGEAATNARADLWVLTQENHDLGVMCRVGDEIRVQLPEQPSSGREWRFRSGPRDSRPPAHRSTVQWDGVDTVSEVNGWDDGDPDDAAIDLLRDDFFRDIDGVEDQTRVGVVDPRLISFPSAPGTRELVVTPTHEGDAVLELELVSAWDPTAEGSEHYSLDLHVRSRQLGDEGLLAPNRADWVAEHSGTE